MGKSKDYDPSGTYFADWAPVNVVVKPKGKK